MEHAIVAIHESYWPRTFGHALWNKASLEEKEKMKQQEYKHLDKRIDKWLRGESHFYTDAFTDAVSGNITPLLQVKVLRDESATSTRQLPTSNFHHPTST